MKSKSSKKNLSAIRELVESLSDRDVKTKRDIRLFEDFFVSFPIPVTIWAVTKEGTVVSQRGNGLVCENAQCIETLFEGESHKDLCVEMHKDALSGTPRQELLLTSEKTYYASIIPRRDESEEVSGVAGLAWDVTPNYTMLRNLEEIQSITEDLLEDADDHTKKEILEIQQKASQALSESRLYQLINQSTE